MHKDIEPIDISLTFWKRIPLNKQRDPQNERILGEWFQQKWGGGGGQRQKTLPPDPN